ncbi:NAD(P)-dependent alcohol dehydrogenase [Myxococcus landrumensis]|uniref:NAD(P)-dependent alcohol dehydrogenase n=1 Tax=Myxococcus landrumensis TaxID=2813577 RepID=A0ABX7NGJ5_9BACT|nr:NAD(P)-dependent alcohol dehydrogenase [Myxococcus landrumus]QSQ15443.1 NAD(P)-dependent alcohol dehydrogenase [Myxococcus landrumus]
MEANTRPLIEETRQAQGPTPQEMNAIALEQHGPPEVLRVRRLPVPALQDKGVLVRVHATAVSPGDCRRRASAPARGEQRGPKCVGLDVAGEVVSVGGAVTHLRPGERVYGFSMRSVASAEYALLSGSAMAAIPASLTFQQAAAVPLSATTALQALRDVAKVKPGERVLVVGASGGVGTFAVQLARILGADVTGVCSSRHVALVRELGASQVLDHAQTDFTRASERYDVVLNTTFARSFLACRRVLVRTGRYVTVAHPAPQLDRMLSPLLPGPRFLTASVTPRGDDLRQLSAWIDSGQLRPVVSEVFPATRFADAHRACEAGRTGGKLVVDMESLNQAGAPN